MTSYRAIRLKMAFFKKLLKQKYTNENNLRKIDKFLDACCEEIVSNVDKSEVKE